MSRALHALHTPRITKKHYCWMLTVVSLNMALEMIVRSSALALDKNAKSLTLALALQVKSLALVLALWVVSLTRSLIINKKKIVIINCCKNLHIRFFGRQIGYGLTQVVDYELMMSHCRATIFRKACQNTYLSILYRSGVTGIFVVWELFDQLDIQWVR